MTFITKKNNPTKVGLFFLRRIKIFKIGEFSKLTQISVRMLRYYYEMDLLKPVKKVDKFTNHRL